MASATAEIAGWRAWQHASRCTRLLQLRLLAEPDAGATIPGSGGLRKIRWAAEGRGKRGGVRVIYYWAPEHEVILLLLVYGKKEQDDSTEDQRAVSRRLVEDEFR